MLQHQKNLLSIHAGEDAVVKEAVLPTVWSCAIGQVTVFSFCLLPLYHTLKHPGTQDTFV